MTIGKKRRALKRKGITQPEDVRYPALDATLEHMKRIVDAYTAGRIKFVELEAWALRFMKEKGIKNYNGAVLRGTAIYPTGEIVDWDGLQKALGQRTWKKILGEPQPDKSKLEALIELGEVDADLVSEYVTDKENKAYVKITRVTKE
jgi:hypothetical protein